MREFGYRDYVDLYNRQKSGKEVSEYTAEEIYNRARCMLFGVVEERDVLGAIHLFERAAQMGSARAHAALAEKKIGESEDEFLFHAKKASEEGIGYATYLLALYKMDKSRDTVTEGRRSAYFSNLCDNPEKADDDSALGLALKAVGQGYAKANGIVAACYFFGVGCAVNRNLAFQYAIKIKEIPDSNNYLLLGDSYANGFGTSTDYKKAMNYYSLAKAISPSLKDTCDRCINFAREQIIAKQRNSLESKFFGFTPVSNFEIQKERSIFKRDLVREICLDDLLVVGTKEDYEGEDAYSKYCKSVILRRENFYENLPEAVELLKDASDNGCPVASYALYGLCQLYQSSVKDCAKAEDYLNIACEQGHARAMYVKGYSMISPVQQITPSQTDIEGYYYCYMAKNLNDPYALMLWDNTDEKIRRLAKEYHVNRFIDRLVANNDVDTMLDYGRKYSREEGEIDYPVAVRYYKKAYEMGCGQCLEELYFCYRKMGERALAFSTLRELAEKGNTEEEYEYGYYLLHGMTPDGFFTTPLTDRANALICLKRAADKGHEPSVIEYARAIQSTDVDGAILYLSRINGVPKIKYDLGKLYQQKGVAEKAVQCFEEACAGGIKESCYDLGVLSTLAGQTEIAKEHYLKIANEYPYAANNLAQILEGERDYKEAHKYYKQALALFERAKGVQSSAIPSVKEKIARLEENRCPNCGEYYTKESKKVLFTTKEICSKCKKTWKK